MRAGIDEAGRGPVIGPLVIAMVSADEEKLVELGVDDSKKLNKEERELLFEEIMQIADIVDFVLVLPEEIDKYNLNELEARKVAYLLDKHPIREAIVDSPDPNPKKYEMRIRKYLKKNKEVRIIAENKAERYPLVAAASIIAKVIRDREIEKIKETLGIDFGSGYPSDPKTKEALDKYYMVLYDHIRKKWSISKRSFKKLTDFIGKGLYK